MLKWSFEDGGDCLNWDEGMEGKGLVTTTNDVHTWDTEEYETHWDYCRAHPDLLPQDYFWIAPTGRLAGASLTPLSQEFADIIQEADPRLHYPTEEGEWQF